MIRGIGDDKEYTARCDAETLADAKAIMADKARLAAAKKVASGMIPDKERNAAQARAKLNALKNLAKTARKR